MDVSVTCTCLSFGCCLCWVSCVGQNHQNLSQYVLQELPKYLEAIVPPVLACFTDQDARVRYYACEAMYNIAKVAKGEILVYFNHIFDALCKVRHRFLLMHPGA